MESIINKCKVYLPVLAVSLLTFSCSDSFLDRNPLGTLDEQTYLNTEDAGYKLLVNCYQPLLDMWNYQQMRFDLGDQITDDCSKGGSDATDRITISELTRGNPPATNEMLTNLWNHRYNIGISSCNVFLNLITPETQLIKSGGAFVSKEEKQRWIAEAKFMRAFYYFDLAAVFANVPIIDKPLNVIDKNTITKSDKEDVRKFIMKDLDEAIAETNLPSAKALASTELGRITKEAALSFRARVKMFFGDYEGAKSDLKTVVESNCYDLVDNYETLFNSAANGYMSKEAVFITLYSYNPPYNSYTTVCPQMDMGRNITGGWGGECPTNNLVAEYETGDPRLVHTILASGDVTYKQTKDLTETHNYTGYDDFTLLHSRKHWIDYSRRVTGDLMQTDWSYDYIRYADVLLMYAECLIETNGDKQLAVDLINKVRHRAFVTTTPTDSYAKYRKFNVPEDKRITEEMFNAKYKVKVTDDLRAAVRHERRVELACEGLRYFDLIRWKTFVPTMQAFSKTEEGKHSGAGSLVTDKTWPYPIPQNEIDYVGGSLTQNENY